MCAVSELGGRPTRRREMIGIHCGSHAHTHAHTHARTDALPPLERLLRTCIWPSTSVPIATEFMSKRGVKSSVPPVPHFVLDVLTTDPLPPTAPGTDTAAQLLTVGSSSQPPPARTFITVPSADTVPHADTPWSCHGPSGEALLPFLRWHLPRCRFFLDDATSLGPRPSCVLHNFPPHHL